MKRALILLLIFVICLSFVYAAVESVHDCEGEDCPICKIVAVLSRLFTSSAVFLFLVSLFRLARFAFRRALERENAPATPVSLRVKLSF